MQVGRCTPADEADWLDLRHALWPHHDLAAHAADVAAQRGDPGLVAFIARSAQGEAVGLAEAALRRDYVNGCKTSPVAFLEGIYVRPDWRGQGVARQLVAAVEAWGRAAGCSELASDALVDNTVSHAMHRALGFAETQRVVFFRKLLGSD